MNAHLVSALGRAQALSAPHLSGTVVTIAAIAAGVVLLVLLLLFLRSRVSTPRAAEDARFRRASELTSGWSRNHAPSGDPEAAERRRRKG